MAAKCAEISTAVTLNPSTWGDFSRLSLLNGQRLLMQDWFKIYAKLRFPCCAMTSEAIANGVRMTDANTEINNQIRQTFYGRFFVLAFS
jgi:hypothetical protein